jgi:phosphohistidine swiveling domain-containing protein
LIKRADRIEREFRDTFLPDYSREIALREAVDFDRLATPDLIGALKQLHDDFVYRTHVEVDVINVAASFYFERAKRLLAECGLDPAEHLSPIYPTDYDRGLAEAAPLSGSARREVLLAKSGHRALIDYELACPRYGEDPAPLEALCEAEARAFAHMRSQEQAAAALAHAAKHTQLAVNVACRFESLKEDAKHHSLRQVALIRRAVLALDRRFGFDGLAFYLTMPELLSLGGRPLEGVREQAAGRYEQCLLLTKVPPLSPTLSIRDLEKTSAGIHEHKDAGGEIRGTRVSGAGMVTGRARVISAAEAESGRPIPDFADGDIVVSPMVHPAWLPYFGRAGGFVCSLGGWLSHTAILAREHNLMMIVGARGLGRIGQGSQLCLHLDGRVDVVPASKEAAA